MLYRYVASDQEGKLIEGEYEAELLDEVFRHLKTQKLVPISVTPFRAERTFGTRWLGGRITLEDKLFLAKYISLMLKVGTDLLSVINILIADFEKPAMRNFLLEVRESLSHGRPFYEAFAKYPKVFSPVFINLVRAAETSGNLQQTFEDLSVSLQKEADLRSRVRSAMIYPVVILAGSLAVFLFLTTFALPRVATVFLEGGIDPPIFSRIVFEIGLFVERNIISLLVALCAAGGFCFYFFAKNTLGKRMWQRIMNRTPVIKKIYKNLAVQRFASTYSSLLKAGLPIVEATKITAEVVGTEEFRIALIKIADEGLAKGLTIGGAFRRETVFPKVVVNLIAVSERAGHIEEVLGTVADFYASSVDASIKTLISFLEPVLLIAMGLLVGTIALSIIVPIYQLTSQF